MNAVTETESFVAPASAPHPVRPFYWSVMRELWENRSFLIAPAVVGGFLLFLLIVSAFNIPPEASQLAAAPQMIGRIASVGYGVAALAISTVMHVVVFFYLLDALQSERKDRSVLFWKSMPVSDTTTVLSKVFTALIVSGAIVVIVAIATQLAMMLVGSVILMVGGANPVAFWGHAQLGQMTLAIVYWQLAIALWYAPIAGWLLFVSAWAKRATILWALLPPIALAVFERVAFRTQYVQDALLSRLNDPVLDGFVYGVSPGRLVVGDKVVTHRGLVFNAMDGIDPLAFLANTRLWVGLAVAAAFVAGAIWMRRYREPI